MYAGLLCILTELNKVIRNSVCMQVCVCLCVCVDREGERGRGRERETVAYETSVHTHIYTLSLSLCHLLSACGFVPVSVLLTYA